MYAIELAGEDDAFAAYEAGSAAGGPEAVSVVAPGVATAPALDPLRFRTLALARRASEVVARVGWGSSVASGTGTDAPDRDGAAADAPSAVDAAVDALAAADLDRSGTVAVRARDVRGTAGVDTRAAERALGAVLVDRGFAVDLEAPDHELRALFAGDDCFLGWLVVESERGYGDRAPTDRPFFQPGSMDPLLARALANVALGAAAGAPDGAAGAPDGAAGTVADPSGGTGDGAADRPVLLDPMCGTGGVLVEAGLVGARVVGADAQAKMARGAARNLRAYLSDDSASEARNRSEVDATPGDFDLLVADARRLPVRDGAVDAAVFDVPYGRQSKVAGGDLPALVGDALAEARRVVRDGDGRPADGPSPAGGRAVVVGDRPWTDAARDAGWTVAATFERRVHRSLTRHVLVLS